MKQYILAFLKRGLMAAAGGPVVLAIIYGILGAADVVSSFPPQEVCLGILSITLMAFIAAGITVVYSIEQLPLGIAILLHGGVLYLDYLIMYLLNNWIPRNGTGIWVFTAVFWGGFALVWLCIYASIRRKTERMNRQLHS